MIRQRLLLRFLSRAAAAADIPGHIHRRCKKITARVFAQCTTNLLAPNVKKSFLDAVVYIGPVSQMGSKKAPELIAVQFIECIDASGRSTFG